jgi:hypothetical protein
MKMRIGTVKRETEKAVLVPTSIERVDGACGTRDVWWPKSQVSIEDGKVYVDSGSWIIGAKERDLSAELYGDCWLDLVAVEA